LTARSPRDPPADGAASDGVVAGGLTIDPGGVTVGAEAQMTRWVWLAVLGCTGDKTTESGDTADSGTTTTEDTTTTPVSTPNERVLAIVALTGDLTAGGSIYSLQCITCHGYDGTGIASGAADLTERLPILSDEDVATTILNGQGNMDAYDFLSNQDIADVMAYITASFDASATGSAH
jgi:mono/diheme cytochrome c family protein